MQVRQRRAAAAALRAMRQRAPRAASSRCESWVHGSASGVWHLSRRSIVVWGARAGCFDATPAQAPPGTAPVCQGLPAMRLPPALLCHPVEGVLALKRQAGAKKSIGQNTTAHGDSLSVSASVTGLRAPVTRAYRSMPRSDDGVHGLAAQRSRASLRAGSSERVGRGGCTTVRRGAYSEGHKAGRWRAPRAALPAGTGGCSGSRSSQRGRGM